MRGKAANAIEWMSVVCHKGTSRIRLATVAAIACSAVWGQSATDPATPRWRHIGNDAVEVALAAPATGPVDAVWFSADDTRLYARTRSGAIFETLDFENWVPAPSAPPPPADAAVTVPRVPAPNVRLVAASGRVFAYGQQVFRSDDGGGSWSNLTAYRTESIIGAGQHSLAISKKDP